MRAALVGAIGLTLGVLTAYAQSWLPAEVGSLANSSGSWCLVAFLLALLARGPRAAAAFGALAFACLLAGYVLGAGVRGDPSSPSLLVFWGLAALVVGPPLGLGAHWVRSGTPARAALGGGALCGLLVGEGVYGLTFIADTTSPSYWWGQVAVGLGALGWLAARVRRPGPVALAVGTSLAVAAAFVAVYSQDLLALL